MDKYHRYLELSAIYFNKSVFLIVAVLIAVSCQPRSLPEDIEEVFCDWFINAERRSTYKIEKYTITSKFTDSLVEKNYRINRNVSKGSWILSDCDGTDFTLGYSAPSNVSNDSLYPLLIYLHGGTNTRVSDKGKEAFEMFRFIADTIPVFLASPSADYETPWWSRKGLERILKAVRFMTLYFPVDPDRIILAGVSDGAAGCYAAANSIPAPFAGFIAVSGYGGLLPQLGIQLSFTNLKHRPVYNINGGKDRLFPLKNIEEFINWLKLNGVMVENRIYPDQDHGFDYRLMEKSTITGLITKWRRPVEKTISWDIISDAPYLTDNLLSWSLSDNVSGSTAFVKGRWNSDTLDLQTEGINSLILLLPHSGKLDYRFNSACLQTCNPHKGTTKLNLQIMHHFCYPGMKPGYNCYTVKKQ